MTEPSRSDPYEVDLGACRERQARLREQMAGLSCDLILLTRPESVQWLTGVRVAPPFAPAAALDSHGVVTLVVPQRMLARLRAAADEVVDYEAKWHSTMRDDQRAASDEALVAALTGTTARVGGEWSLLSPRLQAAFRQPIVDVTSTLFRLRRRKHADEVRMMRRANAANHAMYELAREMIRPGINELEVYNELHACAVRELGEPLTYFGQDFRANSRGGAPRNRQAQEGELYILDLGVGFRGFYSDNARTLCVDGSPTEAQVAAWNALSDVFPLIAAEVRPGIGCQQLFSRVQQLLDQLAPWKFDHHLGHGVGLAPHEGPHLNPYWDDHFEVGDFFAVEPGLYHDDLRHGIRLEQNYLVTETGVELLTEFDLAL